MSIRGEEPLDTAWNEDRRNAKEGDNKRHKVDSTGEDIKLPMTRLTQFNMAPLTVMHGGRQHQTHAIGNMKRKRSIQTPNDNKDDVTCLTN